MSSSSLVGSELVRKLMKIIGNDWVSVNDVERLIGIRMDIDELYTLNKTGNFEVVYNVLEGVFYIRRKSSAINSSASIQGRNNGSSGKVNMQKIVESLRNEIHDLIPKPEFERWLIKYAGEGWQLIYNQLLNDGVIEEEIISGMVFIRVKQ